MFVSTAFSSLLLVAAAALCALAGLAHFACIAIGPRAYSVLGAGERVLAALERGAWQPHVVAAGVGLVLLLLAACALSGAGIGPPLPRHREILSLAAVLLLARAGLFPLLMTRLPGNSATFWVVSSLACLVLGGLILLGV